MEDTGVRSDEDRQQGTRAGPSRAADISRRRFVQLSVAGAVVGGAAAGTATAASGTGYGMGGYGEGPYGGVTDGPGVVGDSAAAPTDPDGDGRYEDVNGSGDMDYADAVALFQNLDSETVQNNPEAFDFDENGDVGYSDVVSLFRSL